MVEDVNKTDYFPLLQDSHHKMTWQRHPGQAGQTDAPPQFQVKNGKGYGNSLPIINHLVQEAVGGLVVIKSAAMESLFVKKIPVQQFNFFIIVFYAGHSGPEHRR